MKDIDDLSGEVLNTAIRIHREIGPGLLESVYEMVLAAKLEKIGLDVARQVPVDVTFEDIHCNAAFRVDLLVDKRLIVEIKSVEQLSMAHRKQLLTYLRLMKQPVGLLINFSGATLMEGFHRVVNNHTPSASSRLRVNQ